MRKESHYEQRANCFSQIIDFLPQKKFRQCVNRYDGNYRVGSFTCYNHFLCMAFAQLTYRESLRDIVCCLRTMHERGRWFQNDLWLNKSIQNGAVQNVSIRLMRFQEI